MLFLDLLYLLCHLLSLKPANKSQHQYLFIFNLSIAKRSKPCHYRTCSSRNDSRVEYSLSLPHQSQYSYKSSNPPQKTPQNFATHPSPLPPHTKNLNPLSAPFPGTALIAPSTCSPLSNFLFNLCRTIRIVTAITIASAAVAQSTLNGTTRSGCLPPLGCGYM